MKTSVPLKKPVKQVKQTPKQHKPSGKVAKRSEQPKQSVQSAARQPSADRLIRLIVLLVLIFIIGIVATVFVYNRYNVLQYQEIDMVVKVENGSSSFNTSTEALNFARIYPGGDVTKRIDITAKKDAVVRLSAQGSIAPFITFSDNDVALAAGEYKQIEVRLSVPSETAEGYYDGKLKVVFYRR